MILYLNYLFFMDRVCGHLRARQIWTAFSDFKRGQREWSWMHLLTHWSVYLFNTLNWIFFYSDSHIEKSRCALIHKKLKRNTPNYMNEIELLVVTNSSLYMRNTRYCNLSLLCPRYIIPRRVVVLLQFVLLRIGTLFQDLWEFWTATYVLKKSLFKKFLVTQKKDLSQLFNIYNFCILAYHDIVDVLICIYIIPNTFLWLKFMKGRISVRIFF